MTYPDLRGFLDDLGADLIRVAAPLSPRFEVAALLAEVQASGRAVMCENIGGYPGRRIAGNVLASRRLAARALGTTEGRLIDTYVERSARRVPPVPAKSAPVHEVVHRQPADVGALLPLLTHYERDAAPFLTCGIVLARDPVTGQRGMGIHRMMYKGGNRFGILLANPPLSQFLANAEASGRPLEVAVALGVDPAMLIAAVVKTGPLGPDKMDIAGSLRGAPVELVRGLTVDLEVPARAEVVLLQGEIPADADHDAITQSILDVAAEVQTYVPGYRLLNDPQFDEPSVVNGGRHVVTTFVEVEGAGDYLPPYAGNLDIMTAAATKVGEEMAKEAAAADERLREEPTIPAGGAR